MVSAKQRLEISEITPKYTQSIIFANEAFREVTCEEEKT